MRTADEQHAATQEPEEGAGEEELDSLSPLARLDRLSLRWEKTVGRLLIALPDAELTEIVVASDAHTISWVSRSQN